MMRALRSRTGRAAAACALALGVAAASTGVAGAGEASAKVEPGKYQLVGTGGVGTMGLNQPVSFTGKRFHYQWLNKPVVQTRYGGYVDDDMGSRYVFFKKKGNRYTGTLYMLGIPAGSFKLVPR